MSTTTADPSTIEAAFRAMFRHARRDLWGRVCVFQDKVRVNHPAEWVEPCPLLTMPQTISNLASKRRGCIAAAAWTFTQDGRPVQGLAITLDLDAHPTASLARLRELLGPPTLVLHSGSTWPARKGGTPGERVLAHWRLAQPALPDMHRELEECAFLASAQAGFPGGCMAPRGSYGRWPGTINWRSDPPRLATIAEANSEAEVDLRMVSRTLRMRDMPPVEDAVKAALGFPHWLRHSPHLVAMYSRILSGLPPGTT